MCEGCSPGYVDSGSIPNRKETEMNKHQTRRLIVRAVLPVFAALLLVISAALGAPVPAVVGDWQGALSTGNGSLKVVLHVSEGKNGKLAATLDSPDQATTGIAISAISV